MKEGAGTSFARLRLETRTPKWRTGTDYLGPGTQNNQQFHAVDVVGKDAEAARLMAKGTPVQVTGYLETRESTRGDIVFRSSVVCCTQLLRLYDTKLAQIPDGTWAESEGEPPPFAEEDDAADGR